MNRHDRNTNSTWRLAVLAMAIGLMAVPGYAQETALLPVTGSPPASWTGDAESDFGLGSVIIPDPGGMDLQTVLGKVTGNDIKDLRLRYDAVSDTLYVGMNTYTIAGDVDGDGDPSASLNPEVTAAGNIDNPDFGESESFALLLDLDFDGVFEVIAGVSSSTDWYGFTVAHFVGQPWDPSVGFGDPIQTSVGYTSVSPSETSPDIEFKILGFAGLFPPPAVGTTVMFGVHAFIGSAADLVGEDHMYAALEFDLPSPPASVDGSLGGFVWNDLDADGVHDAGESPIARAIVDLYLGSVFLGTTLTLDDRTYVFIGLDPGTYTVVTDDSAPPLDGLVLTTSHTEYTVQLEAGQNIRGLDFGYADMADCEPCDGKVTWLTLRFDGEAPAYAPAYVEVVQDMDGATVFGPYLIPPGQSFRFDGTWKKGTLGTQISVYVNDSLHTQIHTSCSVPIGPGMTFGAFTVLAGESLNGGFLCPKSIDPELLLGPLSTTAVDPVSACDDGGGRKHKKDKKNK